MSTQISSHRFCPRCRSGKKKCLADIPMRTLISPAWWSGNLVRPYPPQQGVCAARLPSLNWLQLYVPFLLVASPPWPACNKKCQARHHEANGLCCIGLWEMVSTHVACELEGVENRACIRECWDCGSFSGSPFVQPGLRWRRRRNKRGPGVSVMRLQVQGHHVIQFSSSRRRLCLAENRFPSRILLALLRWFEGFHMERESFGQLRWF